MILKKGLISVVIPAFNIPEYTNKTIDSVILQTHRPIEIIVSDDNSPRSLKELVDEKKRECDAGINIQYFRQKTNLNYYWNLQFVIGQACGQYIVLLDHDDWLIDRNCFSDAIEAIEGHANCYMSIANTFFENIPQTILNFYFNNWHYISGPALIKNQLFTTIHPSRSAMVLCLDKLKELNYKEFFIDQETAHRMKVMPDEALVLVCLLASVGDVALSGRVVSVRGMPPESLSKTAFWHKSGGNKMFIPHFLLYQYFKKIGCRDGMQAMSHNLILRYPSQNINMAMIKYLNFNKLAIVFMLLGVLWFNLKRIILFPKQVLKAFRLTVIYIAKKIFCYF